MIQAVSISNELPWCKDVRTATYELLIDAELGVRFFDTAPHYGAGLSEERFGKLLMPFFTDRSAIGGQVKSVDGVELTSPVYLEGGSGFMRGEAAQKQDALWASEQSIVSKMARKAQRDSDKAGGADVVGVNVVMGIDAIDHSTMPTKIVARMLPNMDISQEAKKSFNEAMEKIDENFPGVDADNLEEYLDAASGDLRKQFIRLMDKSDAKKAGFPNIGAVRRAVTDPELYDTPTFSAGVSFGLLDGNKPLIADPRFPHTTYRAGSKCCNGLEHNSSLLILL